MNSSKDKLEKELQEVGASITGGVARIGTVFQSQVEAAYQRGFTDGKEAGRREDPGPLPEDFDTSQFDDEIAGLRAAAAALNSVGQPAATPADPIAAPPTEEGGSPDDGGQPNGIPLSDAQEGDEDADTGTSVGENAEITNPGQGSGGSDE